MEELLDETLTEYNQLSPGDDEVSELSQYLCESIFAKPELACESEEAILKICHRLRTAVERLLELIAESTKQVKLFNLYRVNLLWWEMALLMAGVWSYVVFKGPFQPKPFHDFVCNTKNVTSVLNLCI